MTAGHKTQININLAPYTYTGEYSDEAAREFLAKYIFFEVEIPNSRITRKNNSIDVYYMIKVRYGLNGVYEKEFTKILKKKYEVCEDVLEKKWDELKHDINRTVRDTIIFYADDEYDYRAEEYYQPFLERYALYNLTIAEILDYFEDYIKGKLGSAIENARNEIRHVIFDYEFEFYH